LQEEHNKAEQSLHKSIEEDIPQGEVKKRAVKGVASLFARQGVLRFLGFLGMLVLARILTPEMFGIFAIAQFVVIFFEQVSSLGLSAALLRKKDNITEIELRTVFTLQQAVVFLSLVLIMVFAPEIAGHYDLDTSYSWLIRALGFSLFLASLKTVPSILLQRQLRHDLLAISEVAEYLVYLSVAISMAYMGYGVWALVVATLLRGLTGLCILYYISWWRPAFGFHRETAREVLRFGVPIQLGGFSALANNAVVPVVVGSMLGTAAVGYVNFSKTLLDALVFQPLILIGKVQLRVFSRVQDDSKNLAKLVNKSLFIGSALTYYLLSMFLAQAVPFIEYIVTSKWAPALPIIYIASAGYIIYAVTMPYMQVLKALGDAITPLISSTIRFLIQLILIIFLVTDYDITGYAIAFSIAVFITAPYVIFKVHKNIKPKVFYNVAPSLLAAAMAWYISFEIIVLLEGVSGMFAALLVGTIIYTIVLGVMRGRDLSNEIEDIAGSIAPNSTKLKSVTNFLSAYFCFLQFSKFTKK